MHSLFPGPRLWPLHLSFNEAARATLYKRKAGHVPPRLIPLTLKDKSSRLYTTWSHSYLHSITSALPCPPSPAARNTFLCLQQAGHAPQSRALTLLFSWSGTFLTAHLSPPSSVCSSVFLSDARPVSQLKHPLSGTPSPPQPALFIPALNHIMFYLHVCLLDCLPSSC